MGRPVLSAQVKEKRIAEALREAKRLNKRLPHHVYAFPTPHGRVYVRYEPPGGSKVIVREPFPSVAFDEKLLELRRGGGSSSTSSTRPAAVRAIPASWQWLNEQYFESRSFRSYAKRDQRARKGLLKRTWKEPLLADKPGGPKFGDMPVCLFQTKAIYTLRDRIACYAKVRDEMYPDDDDKVILCPTRPEAANSVVKYIRAVLKWALHDHTELLGGRNWAKEVEYFPPGRGHKTWGPEQRAAFEAKYPPGTLMRLIYDLALFTAQRKADIARLGPHMLEQVDAKRSRFRCLQMKGRRTNPVTAFIPLFPQLEAGLEAARQSGVLGSRAYISQASGKPYTAESVGNMFGEACIKAGVPGYSLHGLRKTAVVELIRANCSYFEIMSITGHRTHKEIERYGREYMRDIAAEEVFEKWLKRHANDATAFETKAA